MSFTLFPEPEAVIELVQRRPSQRQPRHRVSRRRFNRHDLFKIIAASVITAVLLPFVHHGGGQVAVAARQPRSNIFQKASVQADAFHGRFPASITRWRSLVDQVLQNKSTRSVLPYSSSDGTTGKQHISILVQPGQRSIIYNLMRQSGGNPNFVSGTRLGLLPMSLAQRHSTAHEMNLHYVTAGPTWPSKNLMIGIRAINDDLLHLMVGHRHKYQHEMCVLHDSGRGLILDFLSIWDPAMPAAQMQKFVNWYTQWGPKGIDPAGLKQFCVGAK